jgi:hypothetical protein
MNRLLALALLLAGCEAEETPVDPPDLGTCTVDDSRTHWLVSELRFGRVTDGVSDGFDLDEGSDGCGDDHVSPAGEPGIDNAFGALLPILEVTEFAAAEGIIRELIRTGEMGIVLELGGLDDPVDDTCVELALHRSTGAPLLGTDGDILAGQTLDLDATFAAQQLPERTLTAGSVTGGPIALDLPIQFLGADLLFEVRDGAVRVDLHEDGTASGVLAGALDVDAVVSLIQDNGVAQELKDLADTVLRFSADLSPDETGLCTELSVVLAFEAEPVFVYTDAFE